VKAGVAARVRQLIEVGAELETRVGEDSDTPLLVAAGYSRKTCLRLLCEAGAKVDALDDNGWSALMLAAFRGDAGVTEILLEHRADTEIKGGYGYTALILAAEKGHEKVVKLLCKAGADKMARDGNGSSPLDFANKALQFGPSEKHQKVLELLKQRYSYS